MFNVSFNAGATREAIKRALGLLEDPVPMYEDIAEYMVEATAQRFKDGVDPQGQPWAPKSEATLARYEQLGHGRLVKPLVGPSKRLSREIVNVVSKGGVVIGSSLIYSGVMQDGAAKGAFGTNRRGGPIPWGRIPARQWLGISKDDEIAIIDIVDEHIEGALSTPKG